MHNFTDTLGRDWNICVNVGTVRRVKAATQLDILSLMDIPQEDGQQSPLEKLASDPMQVVDVVAVICEAQLKERNITPDAFAEVFTGETLELAVDALVEEVIDFFPKPRRKYLRAIKEATDKVAAEGKAALEKAVTEGVFEKVVDEALSKASIASPES